MFDMPNKGGTWRARGGWVINALTLDFDLTAVQAAGIVGNLGFESAGFTAFHEVGQAAGKGGYGWAQWTADRRMTFFTWARASGLDPQSDEANYRFLCAELRGGYSHTISALRGCHTLEQAVWSVGQTYERPGGTTVNNLPGYAGRLGFARRALGVDERVLQLDDTGEDVKELQRLLGVAQDGVFGRRTWKAVMDFQGGYSGLRADGEVGPLTWAALRKVAAQ